MSKIVRMCKNLMNSNASPGSMALGFATGTLIAILPTPGFGIFIGLFLAIIFKKINKIGLIAAFSLWNPLILVPVYWVCYILGDLIFTPDPSLHFGYALADKIYHHSGKFLVGNLCMALLLAPLSYYLVYNLISLRHQGKNFKKFFSFYRIDQFYKVKN